MPQVGFQCPRGRITHDECRRCALEPLHPCMFSPDVLEKMRVHYDDPEREPSGTTFSPSRVLGCPRQAILEDDYDYYSDIEYDYPKVRGHMMHALMESARYPGVVATIREKRFKTTLDTRYGPQPFTGKCDLIIVKQLDDGPRLHVNIVDYKTITKIEHSLTTAKDEHVWQVNMYAWLVTRTLPAYLGRTDVDVVVDGVEIEYFDMSKTRRFTSYGELHAKGKMTRRRPPREYETLTLAALPLYPLPAVERAIRRRVEQRVYARQSGILPPVLGEEDRWRCERCPVYDICTQLASDEEEANGLPGDSAGYPRQDVA